MTTIKLKNGSGAPTTGDLVQGEPALDLTNKRLYTEDSGGTVIEVGTNPTSVTTGTITGSGDLAINTDTLFVDVSADKVGFGTSSPSNTVTVNSTAGAGIKVYGADQTHSRIAIDNLNGQEWNLVAGTAGASNSGFGIYDADAGSTRLQIDSSGNVGIGTSSPTSYSGQTNLNINSAGVSRIDFDISDSLQGMLVAESGYMSLLANTGNYLVLGSNNTERMRIRADGEVEISGIGNTTGARLNVGSDANNAFVRSYDTAQGLIVGTANATPLKILTNSLERARIDSSGNVGIGTSSPDYLLHLEKAGGVMAQLKATDSDQAYMKFVNSTTGDGAFTDGLLLGVDSDESVVLWNYEATATRFATGGTERMRIASNGDILFNTTSVADLTNNAFTFDESTGRVTICSNSSTEPLIVNRHAGDGTLIEMRRSNSVVGSISVTASATAYNTSSDYRLKENVVPLTGATERVKQLNPSRFNFIVDADTTVDGFLAHEVADVVPEAITGTKDGMRDEEYEVTPAVYEDVVIPAVLDEEGNEVEAERTEQQLVSEAVMGTRSVPDYQGIDQSKLVPLLVATIQELEARIAALESN